MGERAAVVLIGIHQLGLKGMNPIYHDTIKVHHLSPFTYIHTDTFPGAVHIPTVDWYSWWPLIVIVLLHWLASGQLVLLGPNICTQQFRCDCLHMSRNTSVGF